MAAIDRDTIAGGVPGKRLMEAAGRAVARAMTGRFAPGPVLVLCGPGNNGGDGYACARVLAGAGWRVELAALGDQRTLRGDAAWARSTWSGPVATLTPAFLDAPGIVVDGLFGAGLARDLEGTAKAVVERLRAEHRTVVAIDIPSGIDGATGGVRGTAPLAALTVTFARAKPGHLLLPGRTHVGELLVTDIGIPDAVVCRHDQGLRVNGVDRWRARVPRRTAEAHKYRFGHAVVVGGPAHRSGAARLAAEAALRVGAGLVSVACEPDAAPLYAARLTAVMVKPFDAADGLGELLGDRRLNAWLIGPGFGVGQATRGHVAAILARRCPTVIDADALTSFAECPAELMGMLHDGCVLTPHDGEYARLFRHGGDRLSRARAASEEAGAIIVLKGADTVIAAPDGRAAIQPQAPPSLATAGTGDVLAGIVVGLCAQGMPAFEAASAAVWLHATAAAACGPGMTSEDLPVQLPGALAALGGYAG
ncbi:MAG TPA: NAD(P)H-hydrate dehydratase [Geminicoccaceae bacterium]|nr:NAD(P)H-hydrate dehydratase [Geminicoccus sp.]HMU50605.1 NAD(P)H-hydrate dehydratase [Geminicoccaceae bacterium]